MPSELVETLGSRELVRQHTIDALLDRAAEKAVPIEGGPLDGVEVVSIGTLRELAQEEREVDLPIATERFAEVSTPANVEVDVICPECGESVSITGRLFPRLVVEDGTTELGVKWSAKPVKHLHGQRRLPEVEGQLAMDESIDDLRLRILRAVQDLDVEHDADHEPGPPPTLEYIAQRLELATESDRGDLEESLYAYSQADPPLVEIRKGDGGPVTYHVITDGIELIELADAESDLDDEPDGDA